MRTRLAFKKTEHSIQNDILTYLRYNGFMVLRNNSGAVKIQDRLIKFGQRGSADILAWKNGVPYAIECKTKTGRLSEFQKQWLEEAKDHGIVTIVARSVEDVISVLTGK